MTELERAYPRPIRRLATLIAVLATFAATATADAKRLVRYDVGGGLAGAERSARDPRWTGRRGRRAAGGATRHSASRCRRSSCARSSAS